MRNRIILQVFPVTASGLAPDEPTRIASRHVTWHRAVLMTLCGKRIFSPAVMMPHGGARRSLEICTACGTAYTLPGGTLSSHFCLFNELLSTRFTLKQVSRN